MADIHISKLSAAQRQIDAAIRWLFQGDDELPIYTVAAAAYGILQDVSKQRGRHLLNEMSEAALSSVSRELLNRQPTPTEIRRELPAFMGMLDRRTKRPANFLKHADRDASGALKMDTARPDDLLLRACCVYADLGLELTREMHAFSRWHLAAYPSAEGDQFLCVRADLRRVLVWPSCKQSVRRITSVLKARRRVLSPAAHVNRIGGAR